MSRLARTALASVVLAATFAHAHAASATDQAIVEVHFAMGTPVAITARGDDAARTRAAMRAAFGEIRRLESILTAWDRDSETSRVNRDAGGAPREVAPELAEVLAASLRLSRETDGGFSILVGPIVDAWRAAEPGEPSTAALVRAASLARPDGLTLDAHRVALREDGMRIDLDGIAKGFAADRALALVREHGVRAAIVNLGGSSMAAFGDAGDGGPGWEVEVPMPTQSRPATIRLVDEALSASSSGNAGSGSGEPARPRVVVDPRTGRRVARDATAIVVHPSATDAEAWSKALLVGSAAAAPILAKHGVQAILQDGTDTPLCSARFRNLPVACKVLRPAAAASAPRPVEERVGG